MAQTVVSYASVALVAHGLFKVRHDSFGARFYYNKQRSQAEIAQLRSEIASASHENGREVFYNLPSHLRYQHIWRPLAAQVVKR